MDTNERHIKENGSDGKCEIREAHEGCMTPETGSLKPGRKICKNNSTRKVNGLWIWLGVIILIFILIWWLFSVGTFNDIIGAANG